ncbi:MAG: hypothetical protein ACK6AD_04930, partial [Cyanobacteriota bacterium]
MPGLLLLSYTSPGDAAFAGVVVSDRYAATNPGLPRRQGEVPQMELKNADRPGWAQMTTGLPMD